MINANEYLDSNKNIGSILYYPGAGNDFETMKLFIDSTTINTVYYADYLEKFKIETLIQKLGDSWSLINQEEIFPKDFNRAEWSDFWYNLESALQYGQPENAYALKLNFKNDVLGKEFVLYYLGTEAIMTYHILLQNNIKPDVIILQDHGSGCNWVNQVFGYSDEQEATFYESSKASGSLPQYIFVGENTKPWYEYKQLTTFGGNYGSAGHARALFVKEL